MLRPLLVRARIVSVKRFAGSLLTITLRRSARPLTLRLYLPLTKIRALRTRMPLGARKRTRKRRFARHVAALTDPPLI